MADVAIRVEGLCKQYRLGQPARLGSLRESLTEAARAGWRRLRGDGSPAGRPGAFWALRDVSFDVGIGEVIGIIGRNGAGKSTLLRILSRITEPTSGRAMIRGRVGSLLEVGTGFHPELTGRENIYMNGAVLGMRKAEIVRKFDEIVAFADIGPFLDTPVKRYSSGMQVRLAFAVAAHLEPEVLIVDEVLAVGDAEFQKKCLGKMRHVSQDGGRTVLFVSHSMDAIQRLCARTVLLDRGRAVMIGETRAVVAEYLTRTQAPSAPGAWIDVSGVERSGEGSARVTAVQYRSDVEEAGGQPYPDGPLTVGLALVASSAVTVASVAVTLYDVHGTKLVNADTIALGQTLRLAPGEHRVTVRIPALHLNPGVYVLGLWLAGPLEAILDYVQAAFEVEVVARPRAPGLGRAPRYDGVVTCDLELLETS
ncbi:MAG: ABC transporter ATP-binding protein [Deltaproteobacteria bacterium]